MNNKEQDFVKCGSEASVQEDEKENNASEQNNGNYQNSSKSQLSQQHPTSKGGVPTDMFCPSCREEICGYYLPTFKCPHCDITIWRDETGDVTNFENFHACPECGRGSAIESAKESLVNGLVSCFHALLLHGFQLKYVKKTEVA